MKQHNTRNEERRRINHQPYPDNPFGLPYDNEGNIIRYKHKTP